MSGDDGRYVVCTEDGAIYGRHLTLADAREHARWINDSDPAAWAEVGAPHPPHASVWLEVWLEHGGHGMTEVTE